MVQTLRSRHRVGWAVAALVIVGSAVAGFGIPAHAHSEISGVSIEACTGGTVERGVTVSYSTAADFTTGVRFHIVSGTPDGPTVQSKTLDLQGPTAVTVALNLAPGTYYVDWEDRSGDGVTWSGRHSGLSDFYRDIFLSTLTVVVPCAVVTETTTTTPVTTIPAPTTTAPGQPPITPLGPPPSTTPAIGSSTTSSVPPAPPTATAVATSTTRPPLNTLVATGGNATPMLMLGTLFVGLGAISLVFARRSPSRPS